MSRTNWAGRPLLVCKISDFKGLENTAICIIGARSLSQLSSPLNSLYVAMTRATSHLWIATTPELGALVESVRGISNANGER